MESPIGRSTPLLAISDLVLYSNPEIGRRIVCLLIFHKVSHNHRAVRGIMYISDSGYLS